MRLSATLLLAGLLAVWLVLPAGAAADGELQVDDVDLGGYPTVEATISAPRELVGRSVPPSAFTVREAGAIRPATISRLPNDDLEVVLLMDTSGSMKTRMDAAKTAARGFVDQLPPGVRVAVVGFGGEPDVVQPFTADHTAVEAGIEQLDAGGSTALYEAVTASLDEFSPGASTRRSIVLLSDGGDTVSDIGLPRTARALSRADTTLYAVELQTAESDTAALGRLADAAGGRVAPAQDTEALAGIYDEIASLLVNRYRVAYTALENEATTVSWSLDYDGVSATTTRSLRLPKVSAPGTGESPTLQVVSADSDAYPEVELRVIAPRQLSEEELDDASFTVVDAGQVREVEAARVKGVDLDVVLVLDTSGSMAGRPLEEAKAAAIRFVRDIPDGTSVAVVSFSDRVDVLSDFSRDSARLEAAIEGLSAGRETALYDALVEAADLFPTRDNTVRSMVLLSDGGDTVSRRPIEAAELTLASNDVALHVVGLDTPETEGAALKRLAEQSGIAVVSADDPSGLRTLYEGIADDVGNQYVLRYQTATAGQTQVRIRVDAGGVAAEGVKNVELPASVGVRGFLGTRTALLTGIAACYLAMALAVMLLLVPKGRRALISGIAARNGHARLGLAELAERATLFAEGALRKRGLSAPLNAALERAGINLRPGEFIVLAVSAMVAAMAVGLVLGGLLLAIALVTLTGVLAKLSVSFLGNRRSHRFGDQLAENLQLLAGSLRAGYGIMQAIDSVAREADQPTAEEFRRLLVETRLGRDLDEALDAMGRRIGSEDFEWVIQAMEVHREVGGDLAEVLETVASTIRDRNQIRRQIKALSAEGRLSAYILLALPFGVGFMISLVNPGYLAELTHGGALGWGMILTGLVLMTVGTLWMRKVVRLVF